MIVSGYSYNMFLMYVLDFLKSIHISRDVPSRKATVRQQQRPVKRRFLDGVTPKESKQSETITTPVFVDLVTDGSQIQSANGTVTAFCFI
jgi:hypothetical protein